MENRHLEKFREFLDSDTPNAKATYVVLCALMIASIPVLVFAAATMGNAVQVFKQFGISKNINDKKFRNSVKYLKNQKLIEYVADKDGKTIVKITAKGESKLRAFAIDLIEIKKPKQWDGKWRLVMYDLPIRFKKAREALRWKLKELGFYQFQKSAWIYPYLCEDEIIFVADFYGVGKYVEIMTVQEILRDEKLKRAFNLA